MREEDKEKRKPRRMRAVGEGNHNRPGELLWTQQQGAWAMDACGPTGLTSRQAPASFTMVEILLHLAMIFCLPRSCSSEQKGTPALPLPPLKAQVISSPFCGWKQASGPLVD